ncbi:MAG TPA: hypothetical protein VGN88_04555, partial [Phycisphaerae bacterium]|jgi:hypothetical protein
MPFEDTGPKAELPKRIRPKPPALSPAAERFIASMPMDYEKWHDGTGYDLTALAEITGDERARIADIIIQHKPRDWRDIEALAQMDLPQAK